MALSACDRREERIERMEDIAEGVSEQVRTLNETEPEERAEDGNT